MAWSPLDEGKILGASEDMTVCLWDIQTYTKGENNIQPKSVFKGHTSVVGVSITQPSSIFLLTPPAGRRLESL